MLRSEGVGGARYYAGPYWLPPYFALLEFLAAPHVASDGGAGAVPHRIKQLLVELSRARGDVADAHALPDSLMLRLLSLLCGTGKHAPCHVPMLLGAAEAFAPQGAAPRVYSSAATHGLLRELEVLRASKCIVRASKCIVVPQWHNAPAEGANSRAHSVGAAERALSLSLSQSLAGAILNEVALAPRGSCWAAV